MKTEPTVHLRFAPSPTGELHLGGARTALFNWLFARHNRGQFHLRIEDTDKVRSKDEYTDQILSSLRWLGLNWDGPVLHQSQRLSDYKKALQILLKSGQAYRCFCSKDQIEQDRQNAPPGQEFVYPGTCRELGDGEIKARLNQGQSFTIRLKIPTGETVFNDRIYGTVRVNNREIDDFIIARSDGSPVYNLVVVVDDHDMDITHVIRGEDHISNTPKQILIYQALNYAIPEFAHLPMILGEDKKRLSKRHNAPGIQAFRDAGYPPPALLNYLALLGWNPDNDQEIFSTDQLIELFQLEQVQKKGAVYDEKKLNWVCSRHLLAMSDRAIFDGIRSIAPDWNRERSDEYNLRVIEQLKPRARSLRELMDSSGYFYAPPAGYDEKTSAKRWPDQEVNRLVHKYLERLQIISDWNSENIEEQLRETIIAEKVAAGKLIHPVRLALTGIGEGPSLFILMEILGRETCFSRLKLALEKLP
ncbi:MAG: glutamate--tRNA ligase [Candidatus Neomarinimicrobiota bacterium]